MIDKDNPYGLPPVPPPNPHASPYASPYASPPQNPYAGYAPPPAPPQPPSPFANPYNAGGYAPPPGPPPPGPVFGSNPYAPPSAAAQAPAWAQSFGVTQELATPGSRFVARLLDGFLYLGAALAVGAPLAAFAGDEAAAGVAMLAWMAIAIYQWYLISTTGQSLGKKWMRVRIVKLDGSPVDFSSGVLLRIWALHGLTLVGSFVFLGSLLPLVDALMIFGDDRRCLHDQLAGTKVIVA